MKLLLNLVLGTAKSGKTTYIMNLLAQRAKEGLHSILLVPEQYSSSAEMMVFSKLRDTHNSFVQVLSFRTLAERILKSCGGQDLNIISDAARVVFIRRAVDLVGDELHVFARQKRSTAFCDLLSQTIHELKTAGVNPTLLTTVGMENKEEKFEEIALIYAAYEGIIAQSAMDPEDVISLSAQRAQDSDLLNGKACFIDNFDGFTSPEYKMIGALLTVCEECYVSLCCDNTKETDDGLGLFSPVRQTAARIIRRANKAGITNEKKVVLEQNGDYGVLQSLNKMLSCGFIDKKEQADGKIFFNKYEDEYEESRYVAAKILDLARKGVPYSKMAVVCRDMDKHKNALIQSFNLYGIPVFIDAVGNIEYSCAPVFIRSALNILQRGINSFAVLDLLKTGLCGFEKEEISILENYVFTWNPKAQDWKNKFENNPDGLLVKQTKDGEKRLAIAERVRAKTVPKLEKFISACKNADALQLSRQIYILLDSFEGPENLDRAAKILADEGDEFSAGELLRSWDMAMGLLDEMSRILKNEIVSPKEYDELFLILLRGTDFGTVAQSLECAVFTSADRMRLGDIEHCFIVGVNEGDFPRHVGYSGLLNHNDRDLLVEKGAKLPGSFENRILLEQMFFYRALTSPLACLYLSSTKKMQGEQKSTSSSLEPVIEFFQPLPMQLTPEQLAATQKAAFDMLGNIYKDNTAWAASIYTALRQETKGDNKLYMLESISNSGEFKAKDIQILEKRLGREMNISPTRAENYFQCAFSYFMERVLGVKPRRKAEISPMESGTFVHYVLEQVMKNAGKDFAGYSNEKLLEETNKYADGFIQANFPPSSLRQENLLERIKASLFDLLLYMRDTLKQSGFETDALEFEIAENGDVEPLRVQSADGRIINVSGKIDRVDVLKRKDKTYICIVDYKTGSKEFNLSDVYYGINMQMLIYLHALAENAKGRYENPVPAGVLYVMADPAPKSGARGGNDEETPVFAVDGLVLDDEDVLKALDREGNGIFLPIKHKKGVAKASGKLAALEKMGKIEAHIEDMLKKMADEVYTGNFDAMPLVKANFKPCNWCAYKQICRHEDGRNEKELLAPKDIFN